MSSSSSSSSSGDDDVELGSRSDGSVDSSGVGSSSEEMAAMAVAAGGRGATTPAGAADADVEGGVVFRRVFLRPLRLCVSHPCPMLCASFVPALICFLLIFAGSFRLDNGVLLQDRSDRAYRDQTALSLARETFANLSREARRAAAPASAAVLPTAAAAASSSSSVAGIAAPDAVTAAATASPLLLEDWQSFSGPAWGAGRQRAGTLGEVVASWLMAPRPTAAPPADEAQQAHQAVRRRQATGSTDESRSRESQSVAVQFEIADRTSNILTSEHLAYIRSVEDALLALDGVRDRCLQPPNAASATLCQFERDRLSITRYYYPDANGTLNGAGSQLVSDVDATTDQIAAGIGLPGPYAEAGLFVEEGFNSSNPETPITRFLFTFGVDDLEDEDEEEKLIQALEKWQVDVLLPFFLDAVADARGEGLRMFYYSEALKRNEENTYLFEDLAKTGISLAVVLVFVIVMTGSVFLSIFGMLLVLLSVPVATGIYSVIFPYYGTLHILSIYIIVGIGADDLFLFFDSFKELGAEFGGDDLLESRLILAWRRAVTAMLTTSTTTFFAFIASAFTPLVAIRTFGVYAALLVLVNFYFVSTAFPCLVVLWYRHIARRCPPCRVPDDESEAKPPIVVSFFTKFWSPLLTGSSLRSKIVRYSISVVGALLIVICAIVAATSTGPDESELELYPVGTNVRDSRDLFDRFALRGDESVKLLVVVGVAGLDDTGTDPFDDQDTGKVVWDDDVDLWPYPGGPLTALQSLAINVSASDDLLVETEAGWPLDPANVSVPFEVDCWARDLDVALQAAVAQGQVTLPADRAAFYDLLALGVSSLGLTSTVHMIDSTFYFAEMTFNTSLPLGASFQSGSPVRNAWYEAVDAFNEDEANAGTQVMVTPGDGYWTWFRIQELLYGQAFSGMAVSLAFAFVVLTLFTGNIVASTLATVAIGGCVAVLLAVFVIAGWRISVVESIGAIMVVGFSVDYIVHVMHAYVSADEKDRLSRTEHALNHVGVSVLSGALTTLGASFVLFFATVIFMSRYGAVIFTTIFAAVILALTWVPAVLASIGPQGNFGNLRAILCCCRRGSQDD